MKIIKYYKDTKEYFKKFLQPIEKENENLLKYYELYENNIKLFIEKELGLKITIYYSKIVNSKPNFIEWFYIIESYDGIYSSDEYECNRMPTYEIALNNVIKTVFKNIYKITI